MRRTTGLAAAAAVASLFLAPLGCGGGKGGVHTREEGVKATPALTPAHKITPPPWRAEDTPVTVEFLGLTADGESARYRIHVITDKPIEQVDVGIVYTGAAGGQQRATVVWQNAVNGKSQPIEKGKDYEGEFRLGKGATNVTMKALHVAFKDRSSWIPGQ